MESPLNSTAWISQGPIDRSPERSKTMIVLIPALLALLRRTRRAPGSSRAEGRNGTTRPANPRAHEHGHATGRDPNAALGAA